MSIYSLRPVKANELLLVYRVVGPLIDWLVSGLVDIIFIWDETSWFVSILSL